jgi:hypothetical protein
MVSKLEKLYPEPVGMFSEAFTFRQMANTFDALLEMLRRQ